MTRWAQCSPNRQAAAELRLVLLLLCPYKVISAREEAEVAVGSIQKGETLCALSRYCGWDFRVCRSVHTAGVWLATEGKDPQVLTLSLLFVAQ